MKNNRVIFLHGASSSGKTAIAKKLQEKLDAPYLHIGIDKIIGLMPKKLNDWDGKIVEQGFSWEVSHDASGKQLAQLKVGTFAHKISDLFKKIVLVALENDHHVIIDEVCVISGSFEEWKRLLLQYKILYVGLKIDLDILDQRERSRGDRMIGSARFQAMIIHQNKEYDLEINTGTTDVETSAALIINKL